MKNKDKNSLMSDFARAAFCLIMAFALLMMYSGCSEDVNSSPQAQDGGFTEETGIHALFENITVAGKVRMNGVNSDTTQIRIPLKGFSKGSVVSLYELDSVSFAMTGVSFTDTVDNDDGEFRFRDVTLKSPYAEMVVVMNKDEVVKLDSYFASRALSAIVDVRDTHSITLDLFSFIENYRLSTLLKSGVPFEEAKKQVRREFLDALGIYKFPERDDDYMAMESVVMSVLGSLFGVSFDLHLGEEGPYASISDYQKSVIVKDIVRQVDFLKRMLSVPQGFFDRAGERVAMEYQSMLLREKYFAGVLSAVLGAGRCTASQEGSVVDVNEHGYRIVCRSENWHISNKVVDHEFGTVTDSRDGRVYKTVTINFENGPQTWMAENLKYNGVELEKTSCFDDDEFYCDVYGRLYDWEVATGMVDKIFKSSFASVERCIEFYSTGEDVPYSLSVEEWCERSMSRDARYFDYQKLPFDSATVVQGVCPEGWRIPTFDDWETLLQNVDHLWNITVNEGDFLTATPSIEEPLGLGLYNLVRPKNDGGAEQVMEIVRSDYISISVNTEMYRARPGGSVNVPSIFLDHSVVGYSGEFRSLFVRCVKN